MKNSVVALSAFWAVSGCASANLSQLASAAPLVGTQWRLTEYRPADEAIGTVRPGAGEVYMLTLQPDGGVVAQLACNRGSGRWHSSAAGAQRGPLARDIPISTRAACPPGALSRWTSDADQVRNFVIDNGRLNLSLMLDAGTYVWERVR